VFIWRLPITSIACMCTTQRTTAAKTKIRKEPVKPRSAESRHTPRLMSGADNTVTGSHLHRAFEFFALSNKLHGLPHGHAKTLPRSSDRSGLVYASRAQQATAALAICRSWPRSSSCSSRNRALRAPDRIVAMWRTRRDVVVRPAACSLNVASLANCLSIGVLTTAPSRHLSRNCFAVDHCQMHVLRHDTC
jgi:hypothetical protein